MTNVFDVEAEYPDGAPEPFARGRAQLSPLIGGERLGATLYELPPGTSVCPYHYEYGREEWLLVLEGRPTVRVPDEERELEPGDVVCFPEGPAGAHKVTNAGEETARVMILSTKQMPVVFVYPDSDKLGRGRTEPGRLPRRSSGLARRLLRRRGLVALPETLPWRWYADAEVLRREQEAVFGRFWQYAARAEQVAEPGAFVATRAGALPVVVVRGRDGELRAFVNVCRHRGSIVVRGRGAARDAAVPVPRVDVRPGRIAARGAARRPRAGLLDGRRSASCRSRRAWGPFVFVNPDAGRRAARRVPRRRPRRARGRRRRCRLAGVPPAAPRDVRGELEVVCRELPRVLPLRGRARGLLGGRRRLAGRIRAAHRPLDDEPDRRAARRAFGRSRPARPVPLRVPEHGDQRHARRTEPVDRADRPRRPRADLASLDYFLAPDADPAWVADFFELDDQVGREDRALVERVQRGVRAARDRARVRAAALGAARRALRAAPARVNRAVAAPSGPASGRAARRA